MRLSRRDALRVGGGSIAAILAGCRGGGDGGDGTPTPDNATATATATTTPTETSSGPPDYNCSTAVDGDITEDTTWGEDCKAITLADTVRVSEGATLTIEPGVVVTAARDTALTVEEGGVLVAEGTTSSPIYFQGETAVPGHWRGLAVESNAPNTLSNVQVSHAGTDKNRPGIVIRGRASVTRTTVQQSKGFGMDVHSSSTIEAFAENTFRKNGNAGLVIDANRLGAIDAASTYAEDNGEEYILVRGEAVTDDATWPGQSAPYFIDGNVTVEAGLTVDPGARFSFDENSRLMVDTGYLDAGGTVEDPIVFGTVVDAPGYWEGLFVETPNPKNALNHVTVEFAREGVRIDEGALSVTNSTFRRNERQGLDLREGEFTAFSNNEFTNNGGVPIVLPGNRCGSLDSASTYAGGNESDRIDVKGRGGLSEAQTWPATDAPYKFRQTFKIGNELTLEAGVTLVFEENQTLTVDSGEGKLVAKGDSDPVTFTGLTSAPGFWSGIFVESADPGNVISNADIGYAEDGVSVDDDAQMTVVNNSIHDMSDNGIEVDDRGRLSASGNTFRNIGGEDIYRQG